MEANYIAEKPLGYVQLTSLAAATALTVPEGTSLIIFKPASQAIRFRDDGTDPTTTVGYPVAVGVEYRYTGRAGSRIRIIQQAASATVDVLFYGQGV